MRLTVLLLLSFLMTTVAIAQAAPQNTTSCTFGDGKQVSLRYTQVPNTDKSELPDGQPWPPDTHPIYLFTQADLRIGDVSVPAGAYGLYTVPGKKDAWDLVVTRDVKQDGTYASGQDLGRVPMQTGTLSNRATTLTAYFGRLSPDTCTLRLDYGKQRGYTDFKEK